MQPSSADAIIDSNGAIVDATNRSYMLLAYDLGDDVYPDPVGYAAMVWATSLSLF